MEPSEPVERRAFYFEERPFSCWNSAKKSGTLMDSGGSIEKGRERKAAGLWIDWTLGPFSLSAQGSLLIPSLDQHPSLFVVCRGCLHSPPHEQWDEL